MVRLKRQHILILKILLFAIIIFVAIKSFNSISIMNDDESKRIIEKSIDRAITNCYAIEGFYPPNFQYLEDNYNIHIDDSKYFVDYQVFASNVRPIVVLAQRGNLEAEGKSIGE